MESSVITLVVVLVSLALVLFFLQLGEAAWSKVDVAEVVRYEQEHGASSSTRTAKKILDNQPVGVNYYLLAIFLLMYYGPFELGALMEREDEGQILRWILNTYPFAMFFLAEMIPRMLGMKHALWCTLQTARPLFIVMRICSPLTWLFERILKALGGYDDLVDEADVAATAHAAVDDKALHPVEAHLIQALLEAGNLTVRDLMVPLKDCATVTTPARRADLLPAVMDLKHGTPIIVHETGGGIAGHITAEALLIVCASFRDGEKVNLLPHVHGTVEVKSATLLGDVLALLRGDQVIRVMNRKGVILGFVTLDQVISRVFRNPII